MPTKDDVTVENALAIYKPSGFVQALGSRMFP
jgi:hypothetical protein